MARNPANCPRLQAEVAEAARAGVSATTTSRWLDADETPRPDRRPRDVLGALFTPHCAAIHPAKLARGLAAAVERRGVTIYEQHPGVAIEPGTVADGAAARCAPRFVVRATEGYTAAARPASAARSSPLYSLMIATEPLPTSVLGGGRAAPAGRRSTTAATAHLRPAHRRRPLAFGGRGAPYHFGSPDRRRLRPRRPRSRDAAARPGRAVPGARRRGDHPPRGAGRSPSPRDWRCSVGFDRATGLPGPAATSVTA